MKVALKRLTENELELLMNWRMREDISATMLTSVNLTLEGQYKWFKRIDNDESQIRWVIYYDDMPIGSMYITDIDYSNKRCESGWFIAEQKHRSLKLAKDLQQNVYDYAFDILKMNRIYGYVINSNTHLLNFLVRVCGLNSEGVLQQHVYKDGEFRDIAVVGLTKDDWQNKKLKFKYEKFFIE